MCLTWGPVCDVKPRDLRFDEDIEKEVAKQFTDKTSNDFIEKVKAEIEQRDAAEQVEVDKKTKKELREINREVTIHMDRWESMLEFERRLWLEVSNTNEHNRIAGLVNINRQMNPELFDPDVPDELPPQVEILKHLQRDKTCETVGAELNAMNWVLRDYRWFARKNYPDEYIADEFIIEKEDVIKDPMF